MHKYFNFDRDLYKFSFTVKIESRYFYQIKKKIVTYNETCIGGSRRWGEGYGGCNPFENPKVKKSDKAKNKKKNKKKNKTEEMKREKEKYRKCSTFI